MEVGVIYYIHGCKFRLRSSRDSAAVLYSVVKVIAIYRSAYCISFFVVRSTTHYSTCGNSPEARINRMLVFSSFEEPTPNSFLGAPPILYYPQTRPITLTASSSVVNRTSSTFRNHSTAHLRMPYSRHPCKFRDQRTPPIHTCLCFMTSSPEKHYSMSRHHHHP